MLKNPIFLIFIFALFGCSTPPYRGLSPNLLLNDPERSQTEYENFNIQDGFFAAPTMGGQSFQARSLDPVIRTVSPNALDQITSGRKWWTLGIVGLLISPLFSTEQLDWISSDRQQLQNIGWLVFGASTGILIYAHTETSSGYTDYNKTLHEKLVLKSKVSYTFP